MAHSDRPAGARGPSVAQRFQALEPQRRPYLDRARDAARLTIPGLMPPHGHGASSDLPTPYQGVGARGVNNLANKLLLAQFPPNTPFFRLVAEEPLTPPPAESARGPFALPDAADETADDAAQAEAMAALEEAVERALAKMERSIVTEIETGFVRAGLHAALKQLIVAGNVLLHLPPEGGVRVLRLDRFVVRRGPMGEIREIVVKESVAPASLPEAVRAALPDYAGPDRARSAERSVDLYTHIERAREGGHEGWRIAQECRGVAIAGAGGWRPLHGLDWLPLRWSHVDGEDYGRGHVEEYIGDLRSLEGLMQAIVEGAAAASKMTVLVAPNGQTDAEALAEAENGAIIDGFAGDVSIVQAGKAGDFRIAFETVRMLTDRLAFAFLLNAAVQRDAERVTAAEIRFMAAELEDALGGVYSVLAQELQKPLVEALMRHKARAGQLPALPEGVVRPIIVTGLEALGRGHELSRLTSFLAFAGQAANLAASPAGEALDLGAVLKRGAMALGVDLEGLSPAATAAAEPAPASGGAAGAPDLNALAPLLQALGGAPAR